MSGSSVAVSRSRLPTRMGRWGIEELVEPRVRRLVAGHLGVAWEAMADLVWRRDAADGRAPDVLELAALVEDELSITIPRALLAHVDSYRALVDVVVWVLVAGTGVEREPVTAVVRVQAVVRVDAKSRAGVRRAGRLTRYLAETIMDDACAGPPGAHLEVTVADDASDDDICSVRLQFARLAGRGIRLDVRRDDPAPPAGAALDAASGA